jgi:scyllo-inositol 2-dehydrogenase (NADP+)
LLFDLGSHLIDQALVLFGMPDSVSADVVLQRPRARVDDYFHIVLGYGRRRAILHASTLVCEPGPHYIAHGDAGSFIKYQMDAQEAALKGGGTVGSPDWGRNDPAADGLLVTADGQRERVPTLPGNYAAFYAAMAAAIEGNGPVPVTPDAARDVIAVIELAQRSAAEAKTIAID